MNLKMGGTWIRVLERRCERRVGAVDDTIRSCHVCLVEGRWGGSVAVVFVQ